MNTRISPSFALRPQRDSLRHTQIHAVRTRAAGHAPAAGSGLSGCVADSVFKRLPAIGDTPATQRHD